MWFTYRGRYLDGRPVIIRADQDVVDTSAMHSPGSVRGFANALMTGDGQELEIVDRGVYRVVDTGEIIRCSDPQAP